jgi:shikimate 5-dehydrogenase
MSYFTIEKILTITHFANLPWVVTRWMRGESFYGLIITIPMKEQIMKTLRLNNGYEIPLV